MTPPAPGELVFAAPRRAKPPRHLADLTPDQRRAVVGELGEKPFRAEQVVAPLLRAPRRRPRGRWTDVPEASRERLAEALLPTLLTPVRHLDVRPRARPASRCGGCFDGAARRERAHALPRPGHDVRLVAGRLRHELPVLRDRAGRPDPQPVGRRDRRAGRRRCADRCATARSPAARPGSPTSSSWGWASRWPTTTPSSARYAGSPTRRRTASASRSATSRCRRSGSSPRSTG